MESREKETADPGQTRKPTLVNRRSYLKLAGAAAGSIPVMTGAAAGATTRRGIQFTNVVNMVTDAGCDPTGQQACDAQVRNAASDHTLLKFPAGTYKFAEKNAILDKTNIGFLGIGDVRFAVPENFNEKVFVVDRGTGLLFENIDIDLTASGATPGLHLATDDDLQVHDVEFIGQGIHPDEVAQQCGNRKLDGCNENPVVSDAFYPIVRSADGIGIVRNVVAKNAGLMGAYTRTGIWTGIDSTGTIKLISCQFEGFSGNGLYCSRTNGVVQVRNGTFRNNDVSQVRLGSEGSYVANADVVVNFDNSESPNPQDTLNARGIWLEGTNIESSGPEARGCRVKILSAPNSQGGVVAARTCGDFAVTDTRIGVDLDGVPAINALEPVGEFGYPAPSEPHSAAIRNVSITGSASGNEAIYLNQRNGSTVTDSCIQQSGSNRNGSRIRNLSDSAVRRSTVAVSGEPIVEENATVATSGIVTDANSCPLPNRSKALTIEGEGSRANYSFLVSGTLQKSGAMGATIDSNDIISGRKATGQVGKGGRDSYVFTGKITDIGVDGDARVTVDGTEIEAGPITNNTLSIVGNSGRFSYAFSVSGTLKKSDANGASIDSNDTISEGTATGQGGDGGIDSYAFSGELTTFDLTGDATATLNGNEMNMLTLTSNSGRFTYSFSVSGDLAKSTAMNASIDSNDVISGNQVSGQGNRGRDSYAFTGSPQNLETTGDMVLYLNGEKVSPSQFS